MRRSVYIALLLALAHCARADVVAMTWNIKWFPSGMADLRAEEKEEAATVAKAARIIADSYADQCRKSPADVILFAQELRDAPTCSNLVAKTGIKGLRLSAISNYKDNGGVPLWQQTAIMSTLPVVDSGYAIWSTDDGVSIPRGFTYAVLNGGADGTIACFSVHLKSNMAGKGDVREVQKNLYKREAAAGQILAFVDTLRTRYGSDLRVLVAGDFNTNEDNPMFVSEATLRSFYGAHFRSCFRDMHRSQCVTHPGDGKYPPATFDYILYLGFEHIVGRRIYDGTSVSDHNPVAIRLR